MAVNTIDLLNDYPHRLGINKKKQYEAQFEGFYAENKKIFDEIFSEVKNSIDKKAAAESVASEFSKAAVEKYGKRGKLTVRNRMDLSIFLVYYVFPAILKFAEADDAKIIAEAMKEAWRECSGNKNFDYAPYDDIYMSFKEKLFGFF